MMRFMVLVLLLFMVASNINVFVRFTINTPKGKVFEALLVHYASFGTHFQLSPFWVASASLWVEPLISRNMNDYNPHFKLLGFHMKISFNPHCKLSCKDIFGIWDILS